MRDFHADGLRLDAVHALVDHTAMHILEELSAETDALSQQLGRPLSLIAESDLNDPRLITPRVRGGYGMTAPAAESVREAQKLALGVPQAVVLSELGYAEVAAEASANAHHPNSTKELAGS